MSRLIFILAVFSLIRAEELENLRREEVLTPLKQKLEDALNDLLGKEHHRTRRSTGVMKSTIQVAQMTAGRERLNMKSSVPLQKLGFENPNDMVVFGLDTRDEVHFDNQDVYMAVANGDKGVDVYKFDVEKEKFFVITNIADVHPIELEFFSAKVTDVKYKNLFALTGIDKSRQGMTVLKIYEVSSESNKLVFKEIQALVMDRIGPLKYFSIQFTTYLAVGFEYRTTLRGKIYQSHAQILVLKYTNDMFAIDYALAGLSVVDIEAFWIGSDLFLTAVNRRDQSGSYDVSSVIYKYNLQSQKFSLFQYLPTFGARDIEQFEMVGTHYLGVANEVTGNVNENKSAVHSDLYRYQNGKFDRVLQITTLGAKKLKSLTLLTCKSEVLLFYSDSRDNIDQAGLFALSTYKKSIEVLPFSIYNLENGTDETSLTKPHPLTMAPFILGDRTYVVIGSEINSDSYNLFRISYEVEEVQSPWIDTREIITNGLLAIRSQITELFKQIEQIDAILKRAVLADRAQDISGHKLFANGLATNNTYIRFANVSKGNIVFTASGEDRLANPEYFNDTITVSNLQSSQYSLNQTLHAQDEVLSSVVYKDKKQAIFSNFLFTEAIFIKPVTVNHFNSKTGFINNISIPKLDKQTVRRHGDIVITGYKTFPQNQTFMGNISVLKNTNGVDLSQSAILTWSDQHISGTKTFTGNMHFKGSLEVNGFVDKIKVSKDVLMLHRDERVLSPKVFNDDFNVSRVLTYAPVNDVNFSAFVRSVMLEDEDMNITGTKMFLLPIMSLKDVAVGGLVQGLNISDLDRKTVKLNANSLPINSNKTFIGHVVVNRNVNIKGQLNGLNFSDQVVLRDSFQVISGNKTFWRKLVIRHNLTTSGLVDGINISKSAVTLSTAQNVYGIKMFTQPIRLKNDLNFSVEATIDDVKVAELGADVMLVSKPQNVSGWKGFQKEVLMYGNVDVRDKIDDMSMRKYESLFNRSIFLHGDQFIHVGKHFRSNITVIGNLSIDGLLNGYIIPSSFIDLYSDQVIPGKLRMLREAHFVSNLSVDRVDNITISKVFPTILRIDKPARIEGFKQFIGIVDAKEKVTINGTVNDIDISKEVMTTNTQQTVSAEQKFTIVKTMRNIIIKKNLEIIRTIDYVKLSNLSRNVAKLNQRQEIATTEIVGNVAVEDLNVIGGHINGIDIKKLLADTITLDTDQEINSRKIFDGPVALRRDLILDSTLDGIDISELNKDSLKVNENGQINKNVRFKSAIFRRNLTVVGKMHGVKFSTFLTTLVTRSNTHTLNGKIFLDNNLTVYKNVTISGTLNGLVLERDVVLVAKSQFIFGVKTFLTNLTVHGNIYCHGDVDGINITKLNRSVVSKSRYQEIFGVKRFETDIHVGGNVDASPGSMIDGVDVSSLDKEVVKIIGDQQVNGTKQFISTIWIEGNVLTFGMVNGYNWTNYTSNIVYIHSDQYIPGNKTFLTDVIVYHNVTVNGTVFVHGRINNISINQLAVDCVDRFSDQEILGQNSFKQTLHIYDKVDINGSVNSIPLSDEAVTRRGNQSITGRKQFESGIKLTGDSFGTGLVDGENIQELSNDTIRKTWFQNQTVTGHKTFTTNQYFKRDVYVKGLLDSRNFSSITPITLTGGQNVTGTLFFTNTLKVSGNLTVFGNVSEVDLNELERTRITTYTEQIIYGSVNMESNLDVRHDIIVNGTVNGIDLSELKLEKPKMNQEILETRSSLEFSLNNSQYSLSRISNHFSESPLDINYFTIAKDLSNYSTNNMELFYTNSQLWLALSISGNSSFPCTKSELLMVDEFKGLLRTSLVQQIPTDNAASIKYIGQIGEKKLIFIANGGNTCGIEGPSQIFQLDEATGKFVEHQKIPTKGIPDMDSFVSAQGIHYLVVVDSQTGNTVEASSDITLWQMGYTKTLFSLTQTIKASNAQAVHSFMLNGTIHVAVAMSYDYQTGSSASNIVLYRLQSHRLVLHQEISMYGAKDVASFSVDGQSFLVASSNKFEATSGRSSLQGALYVYSYNKDLQKFQWYQMIPMFNPGNLGLFSIRRRTYLTVLTTGLKVSVYEFHPGIGFQSVFIINQQGIQSMRGYVIQNELYFALAVKNGVHRNANNCTFSGSVIVKVSARGINRCPAKHICQPYKVLNQ